MQRHVERPVHARERRQRGRADQLAVVLELLLHGLLHVRAIEAGQHLDDVQPRQRVLALDSRDQIVDRGLVGDLGDDLEQPGSLGGLLLIRGVQQVPHGEAGFLRGDHVENRLFRHVLLVQRIEQRARRVAAARGQRPGDARDRPAVGFGHGLRAGAAASLSRSASPAPRRRPAFRFFSAVVRASTMGSIAFGPSATSFSRAFWATGPLGLPLDLISAMSRSAR